jgi:hypothetical protein
VAPAGDAVTVEDTRNPEASSKIGVINAAARRIARLLRHRTAVGEKFIVATSRKSRGTSSVWASADLVVPASGRLSLPGNRQLEEVLQARDAQKALQCGRSSDELHPTAGRCDLPVHRGHEPQAAGVDELHTGGIHHEFGTLGGDGTEHGPDAGDKEHVDLADQFDDVLAFRLSALPDMAGRSTRWPRECDRDDALVAVNNAAGRHRRYERCRHDILRTGMSAATET